MRIELGVASWLDYRPGWLPAAEADALAATLREQLRWEQRTVLLFGREVVSPRLVAWAGERAYRYSGRTLEPRSAPPLLDALRARVCAAVGLDFNHVLVNRYRSGADSMGLHADDEPELGDDPQVAAVSLGAVRTFVIVPRRRARAADAPDAADAAPGRLPRRRLPLESGSLLVMGGAFQREHHHGVPREPAVTAERINLTFRLLLRDPG